MVLPSTMFSDMELVIDYRSHGIDIDTRHDRRTGIVLGSYAAYAHLGNEAVS